MGLGMPQRVRLPHRSTRLRRSCSRSASATRTASPRTTSRSTTGTTARPVLHDAAMARTCAGTPHAVKLVKDSPNDDYDGGKFALIWWSHEGRAVLRGDQAVGHRVELRRSTRPTASPSASTSTEPATRRTTRRRDGGDRTLRPVLEHALHVNRRVVRDADRQHRAVPREGRPHLHYRCELGPGPGTRTGYTQTFFGADTVVTTRRDTPTRPTCTPSPRSGRRRRPRPRTYRRILRGRRQVPHHGRQVDQLGRLDARRPGLATATSDTGYVQLLKFTPASTGNYEYVSMCSNRGLCNSDDGLCECFKGYTNDNCDTQSSLAV